MAMQLWQAFPQWLPQRRTAPPANWPMAPPPPKLAQALYLKANVAADFPEGPTFTGKTMSAPLGTSTGSPFSNRIGSVPAAPGHLSAVPLVERSFRPTANKPPSLGSSTSSQCEPDRPGCEMVTS